jgi:lipopolysaccharide export system permease protein
MLFDSTLRRELARGFGATLVVILTIVLTMFLIRTVGQAASGVVAPQDVVLLLGYVALGHLPTIMALSLFVAIVVTLGRMYRDSEMAVWFASGIGLARFVRPVLRTGWPVLLVIGVLLLVVWPWGNRNSLELRERYAQRSDLSRVTPGVFQTSSDGRRVFFIERGDGSAAPGAAAQASTAASLAADGAAVPGGAGNGGPNGTSNGTPNGTPNGATNGGAGSQARNVFILANTDRGESVTSARSGRLESQGEDRYLVLERGQRNEVNTATGERTLSRFDTYRVLVSERAARSADARPPRAERTLALVRNPTARNQAELTWRFGLLLGACNLLLLGIGLAATNPRRASNWNLLFALLAFLVYYNLINLSQAWVASGRLSMGVALALLHGLAFCAALALLWWRDHAAVRRPLRARRAGRVAAA